MFGGAIKPQRALFWPGPNIKLYGLKPWPPHHRLVGRPLFSRRCYEALEVLLKPLPVDAVAPQRSGFRTVLGTLQLLASVQIPVKSLS